MTWFVYSLGPIDHNWEYLRTVREVAVELGQSDAIQRLSKHAFPCLGVDEFLDAWDDAQRSARNNGWEGDFRQDPVVFWLPTENPQFSFGFTFKQDNNGTTWVVSPVPLSYLQEYRA